METQKKIIGRCPLCGGNVVKTCKGYRCEHNLGDHPSCVLNINGIIGNRKMYDAEIAELLEKRCILLDGFSTKEGKTFPTVLQLADDGNILMQSVVGKCRKFIFHLKRFISDLQTGTFRISKNKPRCFSFVPSA